MNFNSVRQFALMFLRQYIRTPSALFWAFGFPVVSALLIAPAIESQSGQVYRVGVLPPVAQNITLDETQALANQSQTNTKRLSELLKSDPVFKVIELETSLAQTEPTEELYARLFIERDLDLLLAENHIYAPSGSINTVQLRLILGADQRRASDNLLVKQVAVPGKRFLDWLIPGLIGLSLLTTGLFFVGTRVVEEKQSGLFQRLKLSPFRSADYVAGFYLSFLVLAFFQTLLLTLGFAVFSGFEISGSVLHFLLAGTLGGLTFGSIGFAIASCVNNLHVVAGINNAIYFPMLFLSDVYFKTDGFPDFFDPIFDLVPLKVLCDLFRSSALNGASLASMPEKWVVLVAWFLLSFGISIHKIRNYKERV